MNPIYSPLSHNLEAKIAEIWAKEGLSIVDVVWEGPQEVRVEFWNGAKAWLRQGDLIQGYATSSGVMFTGIVRRKYRN